MPWNPLRTSAALLAPAAFIVAGCGGRVAAVGGLTDSALALHADVSQIDTNGQAHFSATLANGSPAKVRWSVSGGDAHAGAGAITADGLYTPPNYLTEDQVHVSVNAELESEIGSMDVIKTTDSAELIVTPGFLQPMTPGNLSLGPAGTATISTSITEVGGSGGVRFHLASDVVEGAGALGSLSPAHCQREAVNGPNPAYTVCSVIYTAPAAISANASVLVVGSVGGSGTSGSEASNSRLGWTRILLNAAGINSTPAGHQARLAWPILLGSSSGNNGDYDSSQGQLVDCCGGTLGSLVQDASGNQYALSNNHVLARSDQSIPGEMVIQPGLIDNSCTPYGYGPGTTPVATLTGYPTLSAPATNVDAAIARVAPGAIDAKGGILELGARQPDGSLAAAAPGVSSTGGKGEAAQLGMAVAKSGRTTGLTCAPVTAVSVDVLVDYFTDCAETSHAFSKTFTNQMLIAGTSFSDAGDSGALVVDAANAEPVGLFFAGGTDENGVEEALASPVADVLSALDTQVRGTNGSTNYSFVGGPDHPVSCLSYGEHPAAERNFDESASDLSAAERMRAESALLQAQGLLNPSTGFVRAAIGVSKDRPRQGAIALYPEHGGSFSLVPALPVSISGVATVLQVDPNAAQAQRTVSPTSLAQVLAVKQRNAGALMKGNSAIFGVGIGQSLDNPADAAVVLLVDRKKLSAALPDTIEGRRVRVILMDRMHVTRAHGSPQYHASSCAAHLPDTGSPSLNWLGSW